jgi:hypothetical protein
VTETRASLREPLPAFAIATALAASFAALGTVVPLVREYLHVLIAIVFFQTPVVAARRAGRDLDYREVGLRLESCRAQPGGPSARSCCSHFRVRGRVFPLLRSGLHRGGDAAGRGVRADLPPLARLCARASPPAARCALLALLQLVVVAIPEELFFRGYLMERLERVWPPTRNLFGAKVGWALIVSSALFAIGHVAVIPNPQRLAVFFPALLFGWMRARTGSIAAGALYHALCNILADTLHTSYFR